MSVPIPDWLQKRAGGLIRASDGQSWFVSFDSQPQYRLVPVPAAGKFTCHVTQTNNGRRLDRGGIFPSSEEAIRCGLEDLRAALGW
jgi:hypothetical protein